MSLGELSHPVPLSFEPVKNLFRGLAEALHNTLQTPLDVRLKESKSFVVSAPSLLHRGLGLGRLRVSGLVLNPGPKVWTSWSS